ncbi:MAG: hypothetical protein ACFLMY_07945 [Candidatus Brachytrichaceae bacterium NZ_4S206]
MRSRLVPPQALTDKFPWQDYALDLPDIMLLVITAVLSVFTLIARLFFWQRAASTPAHAWGERRRMK